MNIPSDRIDDRLMTDDGSNKMKFTIKNRFTGKTLFEKDADSMRLCVESAVESEVSLRDAYLRDADLRDADLSGADLSGADLRDADLRDAYLSDVYLRGADLSGADLRDACLSGAYLRGACLSDADLRDACLSGAYLRGAYLRGADLSGADLRDACLSDADLRDAYLSDAYLSDADLSGADLSGADLSGIPTIKNIHQTIYEAASQPGALNMESWHTCETTHCRAGWAVTLAGDAGSALEFRLGTGPAAALIYLASDPKLERIPNWRASDKDALADMKRLAEQEAAQVGV